MNLPIRQYFRLLSTYLRPQRGKVIFLTLCLFTGIAMQLVAPQVVRQFIDQAQQGSPAAALSRIAFLFLGVTLVSQIVHILSAYLTENVKWQATNLLRNDLADHTLHLDMAFHNENTPGTMIERIDGDITELSNFFSQFILKIMGNALLLTGVLVLLYQEDWRVGVVFTVFALVMMLSLGLTVSLGVRFWEGQREALSEQFGFIEEVLGGTEDIRANGGVPYVMNQMRRHIYQVFLATRKAFLVGNLTWGSSNVFFGISGALALGLGFYLYSQGQATLGTIYLLLHYSNTLQRPLEQLARQLQDLQAATASINRIQELFDIRPKVQEHPAAIPLPGGPQAVSFQGVTFSYEADKPILRDLSFHLPAGKVMGLLGRTGSGKTTITRLLFRFHDPDQGTVCLNERDLRQVKLEDLRQAVGMVTQEVQLFQASVRDNLTFFDPSVPDEKIIEAMEILGLGEWFRSMPDGLDTKLAAGGRGLSAGEAQLLAFTRVFLKDPGLIIMDEASSRLDPVTEQLIERAIDRLLHNRTAIIVAHRLATVQRADDILILDEGEVLEHGDRVALLADPDSRFSELLRTGMEQVLV